MNISGIIRSVMGDLQASEPKALELKAGEVVKGMVVQLLPENEAVVNIGGVQVRAKLETPLKQGEVTLLQVQPDNGSGQVVLKPLGASGVPIAESSLADVLKNVGLPDTSTNRQIIQILNQSGISLTKENVQAFAQLQSQIPASVPEEEWISSAVVAFKKGIPLTAETVNAVRQAINGPAFHETVQKLDVQMTKLLSDHPSLSTPTKLAIDTFKGIVALMKEASNGLIPQTSTQLSNVEIDTLLSAVKNAVSQQSQQTVPTAVGVSAKEVVANDSPGANLAVTTNPNSTGSPNQPTSTLQPPTHDSVIAARMTSTPTAAILPPSSQVTNMASEDTVLTDTESGGVKATSLKSSGAQINADQVSAQPAKLNSGQAQPQTPLASPIPSSNTSSGPTAGNPLAVSPTPVDQSAVNTTKPPASTMPQGGIPTVANNNNASTDSNLTVNMNAANKQKTDTASLSKQTSETVIRNETANSSSPKEASPVTVLSSVGSAPNEEENWISKLIKAVGVEHENTIFKLPEKISLDGQPPLRGLLLDKDPLATNNPQQEQLKSVDSLKSALLMLLQSDDTPIALKETAQQAIQQITGQQLLLNIDRSSMFSNITMFIPLINANGEQTAAIHIQSRKGSRGEIDSNNCRLVFDLRMKALGDTMVDVQIVDRIVSLRVLNDQPFIQPLLESHREEIATGLLGVGYQFISLKCSPYPEKGQPVMESTVGSNKQDANLTAQLQGMYESKPYKGMDMRV